MIYLIFVTILWAFSFSLIGEYLAGEVDPYFSVWIRLALALILFLPFLKRKTVSARTVILFIGIGSVQLGLMYIFYYKSFEFLTVPEVLVFTILTPIYVSLINDLWEGQLNKTYLGTAGLAVAGAAIIRANPINSDFLMGFFIVQGANLCFAFGQVAYRRLKAKDGQQIPALNAFAWFYLGAFLVATVSCLTFGNPKYPSENSQWLVLIWLGIGASGVGYFLWNFGATKVNSGVLAAMNNALIPAGLLVNLVIWNRDVDLMRIAVGSFILLLAIWLSLRNQHAAA